MQRTVILRHLPGESAPAAPAHLDWFLERPDPAAPLLSFRIEDGGGGVGGPGRPDDPACTRFPAVRATDHRRRYLDYEGPISGGRGGVARISAGLCRVEVESPGQIEVSTRFADQPVRRWIGAPDGTVEGRWLFRVAESG